jgi:hypothetical protein
MDGGFLLKRFLFPSILTFKSICLFILAISIIKLSWDFSNNARALSGLKLTLSQNHMHVEV